MIIPFSGVPAASVHSFSVRDAKPHCAIPATTSEKARVKSVFSRDRNLEELFH